MGRPRGLMPACFSFEPLYLTASLRSPPTTNSTCERCDYSTGCNIGCIISELKCLRYKSAL